MSDSKKLWLTPAEALPIYGGKIDGLYRDIRLGQFPFEYVKVGKRIKISAQSLGLIPSPGGAEKNEGANLRESLPATSAVRA
jgi:hypothetical protein